MDIDKMVYEMREQVSAISDDRRIDDRYIIHLINTARAGYLRKLISRKPCYNTTGLMQDVLMDLSEVSRSSSPNCPLNCTILRADEKLPKLIYEGTQGNWFGIRSVDIAHRWIEVVEMQRAGYLTFEFNVGYGFLNSDYYVYLLFKDSKELKCAQVSGVFEDPLEVDPDLTDYPLDNAGWDAIKPTVLNYLLQRPEEDPVNNSEPDNDVNRQRVRPVTQKEE